jgi:hypothetical protein
LAYEATFLGKTSVLNADDTTPLEETILLSEEFMQAVARLPAKFPPCVDAVVAGSPPDCPPDHKAYISFIKQFGTHWAWSVRFGGKETVRATFSNRQMRQLEEEKGEEAIDQIMSSYLHGQATPHMGEAGSDRFAPVDFARTFIGEAVNANGKDEWQLDVQDSPQPVQYTLMPNWELLKEPKRSNLVNAVRAYIGELGLQPGADGALESHNAGHHSAAVMYHSASAQAVGPYAADHFIRRPGWNTLGTFMFHMPTGWTGSPTIVLVDLSETLTDHTLINTEFRIAHSESTTGGELGVAGISGIPNRPRGVHFHDVLAVPDWSRLRFRLEANSHFVSAHRNDTLSPEPTPAGVAEFSATAIPPAADWRVTFLQVPSNAIRSLLWNDTWCVLTKPTWGPAMPRMRIEGYAECQPGHVLLFMAHISRLQQMEGEPESFGVRMTWDTKPISLSFTGNVLHQNFSEFSMHAIQPCHKIDDRSTHDLEVEFVATKSLALANTEAARQTRRLTTVLVGRKHVTHRRWILTAEEKGLPNDIWSSLPTPMRFDIEVPPMPHVVGLLVLADISQMVVPNGIELRIVVDREIQAGYLKGRDNAKVARSASFHGYAENLEEGTHSVEVQYRTLSNHAVLWPSELYEGMQSQERRLTAVLLKAGVVTSAIGSDDLALAQTASQSSTYQSADAAKANDGNAMPWFSQDSVSQTKAEETPPWWELDLGLEHIIASISIYLPADVELWPSDFDIVVLDVQREQKWQTHIIQPNSSIIDLKIPSVISRWVRVQCRKPGILSLAEVFVFPPQ